VVGKGLVAGSVAGFLALGAGVALADSAPLPNPFSRYSDADAVVLAVRSDFAPAGGRVRVTVYDGEANFLENAAARLEAAVNEEGVALVTLTDFHPGEYAFVAYYDRNGDGKLNRNVLGRPKEPFIFSNDIRPKLRKPTFAEAKVVVGPGEVVVLTLKD
jgi:uncharacterized protein (DUF2141 family)